MKYELVELKNRARRVKQVVRKNYVAIFLLLLGCPQAILSHPDEVVTGTLRFPDLGHGNIEHINGTKKLDLTLWKPEAQDILRKMSSSEATAIFSNNRLLYLYFNGPLLGSFSHELIIYSERVDITGVPIIKNGHIYMKVLAGDEALILELVGPLTTSGELKKFIGNRLRAEKKAPNYGFNEIVVTAEIGSEWELKVVSVRSAVEPVSGPLEHGQRTSFPGLLCGTLRQDPNGSLFMTQISDRIRILGLPVAEGERIGKEVILKGGFLSSEQFAVSKRFGSIKNVPSCIKTIQPDNL